MAFGASLTPPKAAPGAGSRGGEMQQRRQRRHQDGNVYEASGAFHIRYWSTELRDGKAVRVQRSKRLCAKDNKHHSKECRAVRSLQAEFMGRVNREQGTSRQADALITYFWETVYLP